ncbi:hypothetical protein [Methylobacterium sp. E-046]|uniref:hypothetical protein n=1 Tax=Methylobacterium sp. E-046 TaxID=2836576 RepID=UPI001FBB1F1D|nr:hypothetical protein [Methylobacterium sp. E-046]MCJ2098941.1 hypothetical protein [Methylobacterium sp. E-046]
MASPPSSAIAGAAVSAVALADVITGLARGLPLPAATAQSVGSACRRIAGITAPRLTSLGGAAAIAAELIATVQVLARDADPADASAGLFAAAAATRMCAPSSASPVLTQAYSLARALCVSVEAACLGEAFLCEARTEFGDRQAASAARDRITRALEGAVDRVAAALGQPAAFVLTTAANQTCAHLVDLAGSLQPLIRAECDALLPVDRPRVVALRRPDARARAGGAQPRRDPVPHAGVVRGAGSEESLMRVHHLVPGPESCVTCRHFGRIDPIVLLGGNDPNQGVCRFRAPHFVESLGAPNAVWPVVSMFMLCGEFDRAYDPPLGA